ncbi:MAG: TrmJ/YjtD family RNA methyltransferase [bacterium]|nr:TrmJ/YjtD family RNA methyltransferase [bacterium]
MTRKPASKSSSLGPVEADDFPFGDLRVVLVHPRNPLNIGAVARAMSNLGFTRLRLVNAYDVAFREARSAVGASHILETVEQFESVAGAIADCSLVVGTTAVADRQLQHPLRRLEYGGRLMKQHLLSAPAALLFGSEKYGLGNEDLSHCHWLMRIPTRRGHGSMNLGQAVAVCLYELARNRRTATTRPKPSKAAPEEDLERLTQSLIEALDHSGYIKPKTRPSTTLKLRRLVRRMNLNARDAEVWLGILRQIRWKLGLR